jgi:hypothetical protein
MDPNQAGAGLGSGRDEFHIRDDVPLGSVWREAPHRLAVRRAVVGTLMRAHRAMSAAEIRDDVLASRSMLWRDRPLTAKKVTEVLRYQAKKGRVERAGHDRWFVPRDGFSKTSRWRYENWERDWDSGRWNWMDRPTPPSW